MKQRLTLLISISLLFFSCSSGEIPENVIHPEEMKMILYDMFRSEEAADKLKLDSAINTFVNRELVMYNNVFAIHHITRQQFYDSYKFYEERPDLHKALMDSLSAFAGREKVRSYQRNAPVNQPAKAE